VIDKEEIMSFEMQSTRRALLAAAGAGAGTIALTACGSSASVPATPPPGPAPAAPPPAARLANLGDIPVGSAISVPGSDGKPIIVAQPEPGKAVAFKSTCTHMGCTVKPEGTKLNCPCHGSVYEASTGAVVRGPANAPLAPVPVHVQDRNVIEGAM
jgi:cytochrome b6-f complex iron-sulfur subunit